MPDAVRCMNDVVARFVGKRDLGDVDVARRLVGRSALRVGHANHGQAGLGDDHAERDFDIHDVDNAALEPPLADFGRYVLVRQAQGGPARKGFGRIAQGFSHRLVALALVPLIPLVPLDSLDDGKPLLDERKLHVLACPVVRSREHDREILVDKLAQTAEQLVGMPRDLDALDG